MDTISIVKFSKGNSSMKNVGGVTALVLCTLYIMLHFYITFHKNISEGFRVIKRTQFSK